MKYLLIILCGIFLIACEKPAKNPNISCDFYQDIEGYYEYYKDVEINVISSDSEGNISNSYIYLNEFSYDELDNYLESKAYNCEEKQYNSCGTQGFGTIWLSCQY